MTALCKLLTVAFTELCVLAELLLLTLSSGWVYSRLDFLAEERNENQP